jgi:dolichol kinase
MDRGHLLRRMFHLSGPIVLGYYLLPEPFFGIPRMAWVLATLAAILSLEAIRLGTGFEILGLREYERDRLSAYAWAGIGITIGFALFPMELVVPSVFGLCWVDPVIGEMRRRKMMKHYPAVPLILYFSIALAWLAFLMPEDGAPIVGVAFFGSVTAIAAERPKLAVDDDFLMLVVPLAAMALAKMFFSAAGLAP